MIHNDSRFHSLQVVEEYEGPAPDAQNEDFCIVIANEDDLEICVPFLDQGSTSTSEKKIQFSASSFAAVRTRTFTCIYIYRNDPFLPGGGDYTLFDSSLIPWRLATTS